MVAIPRAEAYLTDTLATPTTATINLDTPYVASQSALYVSPVDHGLYLDRDYRYDTRMRRIKDGRVTIMRCLGWGDTIGYVADLRYTSPDSFSYLTSDEYGELELENDEPHPYIPLSAYATWADTHAPTSLIHLSGNRDFFAAAMRLSQLTDTEFTKRHNLTHRARARAYASAAVHHDTIASTSCLLTGV